MYKKQFFYLITLVTAHIAIAQNPLDSLQIHNINNIEANNITDKTDGTVKKEDLYTIDDLKLMDSLLVEAKFNSPLYDNTQYVINDKDIVGEVETIVSKDLLKKRLAEINTTTPFQLNYNPALEKVINSYLKYRKKYYPSLMARAQYFFPMFERYRDPATRAAPASSGLVPRRRAERRRLPARVLWQSRIRNPLARAAAKRHRPQKNARPETAHSRTLLSRSPEPRGQHASPALQCLAFAP